MPKIEEPHTLLHVGGIVVDSHGVVVDNIVLEQYISTMVGFTYHHCSQHIVENHIFCNIPVISIVCI